MDIHDTKGSSKNGDAGLAATALVIGAALGAAVVALQDKKNQDKLRNSVQKVRNWADKTTQEFTNKSEEVISDAKNDIENISQEIKEPTEK